MHARLAGIIVADVAGYVRLMEAYEAETHARLMRLRREVVEPALTEHRGRMVKQTGDGFIAVFEGVHGAVEAAIAIQTKALRQEKGIQAEQRIRFRLGVNLGDVVEEGEDLYGNGVNIAARLQELAEPGGLMISGVVHEQVGRDVVLPVVDLGNLVLKNVEAPVHVFRLQTMPETSRPRLGRAPLHQQPSIAVLPFRTLHGGPREAWFGEGVVEDIIGALARLQDFLVISRNSTMAYSARDSDIRRVGAELGVRYVVSGSVHRVSRHIRIYTELAEADEGTVLWTKVFEFGLGDLFSIQNEITTEIAGVVAPRIRQAEIHRAFLKRPDSMDAYDHFLQALALLHRLREEDFGTAGTLIQRSIALDDSYATSYALASEWHGLRVGQGWSPDPKADSHEALRLAEAAMERDETNVRALAGLGHYKSYLFRDYEGALALFERAVKANPSSAWAWGRSSPTYSYIGEGDEAVRRAERALRLSPLDPLSFIYYSALCIAHYTRGDYAMAAQCGQIALRQNARYTAAACPTAASLSALGRKNAAQELATGILRINPGFRVSVHAARYPYRENARRARLERHLIAAGLPP